MFGLLNFGRSFSTGPSQVAPCESRNTRDARAYFMLRTCLLVWSEIASSIQPPQPQETMADGDNGIVILRTSDIVELLQEWGLSFSVEEINKPTSQTAQAIYEALLQSMINVKGEDLEQPKALLLQDMEFPVCHFLLDVFAKFTSGRSTITTKV